MAGGPAAHMERVGEGLRLAKLRRHMSTTGRQAAHSGRVGEGLRPQIGIFHHLVYFLGLGILKPPLVVWVGNEVGLPLNARAVFRLPPTRAVAIIKESSKPAIIFLRFILSVLLGGPTKAGIKSVQKVGG